MNGWAATHRAAVLAGRRTYRDPTTGWLVMTEVEHRRRGSCCGSGCRHCPYGHERVAAALRETLPPPVVVDPDAA